MYIAARTDKPMCAVSDAIAMVIGAEKYKIKWNTAHAYVEQSSCQVCHTWFEISVSDPLVMAVVQGLH